MNTALACHCVRAAAFIRSHGQFAYELTEVIQCCSIMGSAHIIINEGSHPYDDTAVRFGKN